MEDKEKLNDKLLDKISGGVKYRELNDEARKKLDNGFCPFCNEKRFKMHGGVLAVAICDGCGESFIMS